MHNPFDALTMMTLGFNCNFYVLLKNCRMKMSKAIFILSNSRFIVIEGWSLTNIYLNQQQIFTNTIQLSPVR